MADGEDVSVDVDISVHTAFDSGMHIGDCADILAVSENHTGVRRAINLDLLAMLMRDCIIDLLTMVSQPPLDLHTSGAKAYNDRRKRRADTMPTRQGQG
jgi:hypothetical protein